MTPTRSTPRSRDAQRVDRSADAHLLQDDDRQRRAEQGRTPRRRTARRSATRRSRDARALGWKHPPFEIPRGDLRGLERARARRGARRRSGTKRSRAIATAHPELAAEFARRIARRAAGDLERDGDARSSHAQDAKGGDHRHAQGFAERDRGLAPALPELIGGSADLTGSDFTIWSGSTPVTHDAPGQLHQFRRARVRDGAIANGIALHGGSSRTAPRSSRFPTTRATRCGWRRS